MVETDSPYITPEPYREYLNVPSNIKFIVERLSDIKNVDCKEIEEQTIKNTKRLFKRLQNF